MNRHHPYGGGAYDGSAHRRGGSPAGPGPDRSYHHRGGFPRGRGGFGRGRGSFHGGYDGGPSNLQTVYDQGQHQADVDPYNNYSTVSQESSFYQNGTGSYGGGGPSAQYSAENTSDGYNQAYGSFEDGSDANYDDGSFGMRPQRRNMRRERDDKVHDSIIEERIQRERPCRTLFIRNIKYETNSDDVRRSFEEHGEIKTFFDLIATRGMVFVTYYDLRAAERARDRLQGSEISGRPIDVHYSLPRDDQRQGGDRDKNQQYQGCLIVTLKDSRQPIEDNEVRRKFQQFGDVKSVTPVGDRSDQRYVEYYDMRNCDEAFDRLRHQGLQDGTMDIVYAWEESEVSGPATQRFDGGRDWEDGGSRGFRGRGRGRGRARARGAFDDGFDRRDDFGRDRDRGRYEEDSRRGGARGGYGDRFDNRAYPPSGYNEPTSTSTAYNQPPASSTNPPSAVDERLEQARKVQQLLAALKQPQNGTAPPPLPSQPAPGAVVPPPVGMPPMAQPPPSAPSYYPPPPSMQPPPPYPLMPASGQNPYAAMPPQPSTPQPQGHPGMAGIPPNILTLLQQSQSQPPMPSQHQPAPQYGMPPPPPQQMMSPPPMSSLPPGAPQPGNPAYQQLMSFLASQKRA
ncbi:hypothetical protein F5I97DRAFT_1233147 [Phlebopus sp. FC_14]|nr:hypothetical protein F5I97DRAFT_1233147 [Phlebopus sp. FC_14]